MNRLKELRQKKGDTQEDVAKAMGVTRRGYQKWENEESQIKPEKAQQLADYFEVPLWYLLGYDIEGIIKAAAKRYEDAGVTNYEYVEKMFEASVIIKKYIDDEERFNLLISVIPPSDYSLLLRDLIKISELQNSKDADILLNYLLLEEHDKQIIFELITSLADKSIKSAVANKKEQDET
jgi:transcriptional regulator